MGLAAVIGYGETPGPSGSRSPRARKDHFPRFRGSRTVFPEGRGQLAKSLGPGAQREAEIEG